MSSPVRCEDKSADVPTLTMPIFFESQIPADFDLIRTKADCLIFQKIGIHADLIPILRISPSDTRRNEELALLKKQGTSFDLIHSSMSGENFLELSALLDYWGMGIQNLLKEYHIEYEKGNFYSLPSISDYAAAQGIAMRKDIVDKYQIDLSKLKTYQDFDHLFSWLFEKEPDMYMIGGYFTETSLLFRYKMELVPETTFTVKADAPDQIVNYYSTDKYREQCTLFRKWYNNGYIYPYLSFQNIPAYQLVEAGTLFSYVCSYKPGINSEASNSCKIPMVVVQTGDAIVSTSTLQLNCWGISSESPYPVESMKLLNLLYTDTDLANLLAYGIEGKHYELAENGSIIFPNHVSRDNTGYLNDASWILPNQFLCYIWEWEDPDLWKNLDAFNKNARKTETLGFLFDDSSVAVQNQAINEIASRYSYGLESGQLDPDIYLDLMLSELSASGLEQVQAEIQKQYEKWKSK